MNTANMVVAFLAVSLSATAAPLTGIVPPLAAEARPIPAKTATQLQNEKNEAARVKYSTLIGSHRFDDLEAAAREIVQEYETKKISGDEFIVKFYLLVPEKSGKAHLDDIVLWVSQKPKSYAAWYVLGRQYLNVAKAARGGKWASETAPEQFAEMDKYATLSREALTESLRFYDKPLPSHRGLIEVHRYLLNPQPNKDYESLQAAAKIDPNAWLTYLVYFINHSPRWGGNMSVLASVLKQARSTAMSKQNLAELEAFMLEIQADDVADLLTKPSLASDLYKKAFDANPGKGSVERLYAAAREARKANRIDDAIALYTRIVEVNPLEHNAFFERGVILREENRDIRQHFTDMIASAKLGNQYAQNNIGYYYLTGDKGFPVDLNQAKAWLQLAANQGYQHARDKLLVVEEALKKQKR